MQCDPTLQHDTTRNNTLQHDAAHCNTQQNAAKPAAQEIEPRKANKGKKQQHTITPRNTL